MEGKREYDSVVFYKGWYDAIKSMPIDDSQKYDALCHILDYGLFRIDDGHSAVKLVKPQIDLNSERKARGLNGGAPKGNQNARKFYGEQSDENNQKQSKNNQIQSNSIKKQPNVNLNGNLNANLNVNDKEELVDVKDNREEIEEKERKKDKEKKKEFDFRKAMLDSLCLVPKHLDDWMLVRKRKGGVNTETAFKGIVRKIREAAKYGLEDDECIRIAAERGWIGFDVSWLKPEEIEAAMAERDDVYLN